MTPQEKAQFRAWFPNLNVDAAVVTGEQTQTYNCISWTVGVTDRWLWPGASIVNFDAFYRGFGFARAANGPIAAWGRSTTDMTHGSVSGPDHRPQWESKCGARLRIQHGLSELQGQSYGQVMAFYARSIQISAPFIAILEGGRAGYNMQLMDLADQARAELQSLVDRVPDDVRQAYDTAFESWKATWFSGPLSVNSNPHSRAYGPDFEALITLGTDILPLVVNSLADDENFMALTLYDAIQPDHRLSVPSIANAPEILEGEQGRAKRTVRTWLSTLVR
jgi:hypothetical protein